MRRAARRDANEPEIIRAALDWGAAYEVGISVERLSQKGVADLLIGVLGQNLLVEVKNRERIQGRGSGLTPDQVKWIRSWPGSVAIVETPAQMSELLDAALRETARQLFENPGEMTA